MIKMGTVFEFIPGGRGQGDFEGDKPWRGAGRVWGETNPREPMHG